MVSHRDNDDDDDYFHKGREETIDKRGYRKRERKTGDRGVVKMSVLNFRVN